MIIGVGVFFKQGIKVIRHAVKLVFKKNLENRTSTFLLPFVVLKICLLFRSGYPKITLHS